MSDHITEAEIYTRFLESMKIASGCARQFAHMRRDERWIKVSTLLEGVHDKTIKMATRRANS